MPVLPVPFYCTKSIPAADLTILKERRRMKKDNINELIYNYYQKDEYALKEIIDYYRPMVIRILSEKIGGITRDRMAFKDSLNQCDILLVNCLDRFRYGYFGSFTTFYRRSMQNFSLNLLRSKYHDAQDFYKITPDYRYVKENYEYYDLNTAISDQSLSVHDEVMTNIYIKEKMKEIQDHFSKLDLDIIQMKQQGYSCVYIAEKLNMNVRSVRYRVNKIKKYVFSH